MFMRRRNRMKQQSDRRNIFLRYLGEVANAVSGISACDRQTLYDQLVKVATLQTAEADVKLDDRGRAIQESNNDFGDNVLIVDPEERMSAIRRAPSHDEAAD